MRRFIDLSIYLENDVVSDPPPMRPKIDYIRHDAGAEQMADFFEGLDKSELPDSEAGRSRWFSCVPITVRTSMRRTTITAP